MPTMTSRERMLSAIRRQQPDHTPLYAWTFGFRPPLHLRWHENNQPVDFWYSQRMEHLHTLPQPWDVTQDFKRVDAWLSLGMDDVLDVSIPWGISDRVTIHDSELQAGSCGVEHPQLIREYQTPEGILTHAVQQTGEEQPPGWVVQPAYVPLFEDYNIPRASRHLVNAPEDVSKVSWLYQPPGATEEAWLIQRMAQVAPFAHERGVMTQAWSGFGVDAAVWVCGVENAVMLAIDHPDAFAALLDIIQTADMGRTALALSQDVDMVVERGWYSSIDFWSPKIFQRYFKPRIAELAALAHKAGKLFGYVMTTGVATLGADLADAGVDMLYYADPAQDGLDLAWAKRQLSTRMALAGGINTSLILTPADPGVISAAVKDALDSFGNDGGFILSPVDALFPDTPWSGVQAMIDAWRKETNLS